MIERETQKKSNRPSFYQTEDAPANILRLFLATSKSIKSALLKVDKDGGDGGPANSDDDKEPGGKNREP